MKIFVTGASGYVGGSVAVGLVKSGHTVLGLVRSEAKAAEIERYGVRPILGTLDDAGVLATAAQDADGVVNAAHADHEAGALGLLDALAGSGKLFLHTSGSSIVGTQADGARVDAIYDEDTPLTPSPGRAARVALNDKILAYADRGVRSVILCPSLIYGIGHGAKRDSMQVPWLIALARKEGVAKHYGPGENIWSNVHIDDLVALYLLAVGAAPTGSFYFAENGACSMRDICEAINRMMGVAAAPVAMTLAEAADAWGEGPAKNTMGSNSRVRAVRARTELGWQPQAPSLMHEIERGCYASEAADTSDAG